MISGLEAAIAIKNFTIVDIFVSFFMGASVAAILVSWTYSTSISYLTTLRKSLGKRKFSEGQLEDSFDEFGTAEEVNKVKKIIEARIERQRKRG